MDAVLLKLDDIQTELRNLKKELKGLVQINQVLIHERLNVPIPPPPKEYGEETVVNAKIIIKKSGERASISGKSSFEYKDLIKESANGTARFESSSKSWMIDPKYISILVQKLEAKGLKSAEISVEGFSEEKKESKKETEVPKESKKEVKKEPKKESHEEDDDDDCVFD